MDDIFMIWTHSVDDLQTVTTYLNNIHPTIKFTSNYSFTSIPLTVKSRLIFAVKLPTNISAYYNLRVILNTLRELFHSA